MRPSVDPPTERRAAALAALKRYRKRLCRKLDAQRADLAEAERAAEYRRAGETLLACLNDVPRRQTHVSLPDPRDPAHTIEIALDAALTPQANAARYFKRAAKAERALREVPARIEAVEAELAGVDHLLERGAEASAAAREAGDGSETTERSAGSAATDARLDADIEAHIRALPPAVQRTLMPAAMANTLVKERDKATRASGRPVIPARLQPRRLESSEGWDVLIGRSNEGNDYLTHRLARGEDYWFHVHGAAGSHVILRRGKGANEPSKQTLAEVASWAAFYSQARTAGKVPVIVTRKKYVRKPRKAPPGLAVCEREKTLMVKPQEPPKSASIRESSGADPDSEVS